MFGYTRLQQHREDEATEDKFEMQHKSSRRRGCGIKFLIGFGILAVLAGIFLVVLSSFQQLKRKIDCNCGFSIKEALSRGCKYDAMATSWLPPQCRDDELAEQFNRAGPGPDGSWEYFANKNGSVTYTLEEVSFLAEKDGDERAFWTTHEWHLNHCLFYWRKESRARLSGRVFVEKSFSGEYHTKHCEEVFFSYRPLQEINTMSLAGLNSDRTQVHRK